MAVHFRALISEAGVVASHSKTAFPRLPVLRSISFHMADAFFEHVPLEPILFKYPFMLQRIYATHGFDSSRDLARSK